MKIRIIFKKSILLFITMSGVLSLSACGFFDNKIEGYVGNSSTGGGGGASDSSKVAMVSTAPEVILTEGGTTNAIIQFNKNLPSGQTINWSIENGTSDFIADSGSVTVASGSSQFTIPLSAIDEGLYEGEETFNLLIAGDPGVFASSIIVPLKIQELSPAPVVSFDLPAYTANETTALVDIPLHLSLATAHLVKVKLSFSGSATIGTDATVSPADAVVFAPGETTKTVQVYLINDSLAEPLEDLIVTLDQVEFGPVTIDPTGKYSTLLIQDDDNPALFNITGVRGGTDVTNDGYLTSGSIATLVWTDAPSEIQYEATIFRNDGVSVQCPTQTLAAGTTQHTFSGCTLTEGQTYKASVIAKMAGSVISPAGNDMFPFTVDTTPPTAFNILGAMGGLDVSPDAYLAGSLNPTVVWMDAQGENSYQVTVYNMANAPVCATTTVPANVTSYSFASCNLTAGTTYKMGVVAVDASGQSLAATNNMMQFLVTTVPSGYLILGVTGGTGDTTIDSNMDDGTDPTVHWQTALSAVNYDVQINNMDNSTRCGPVNVPGNLTKYSFSGCHLNLHDQYRVVVTAYDSGGTPYVAANSPYVFRHRVGLYISGTGGSYYRGATVTTCGGGAGDTCDATTPYVISATYSESQIRVSNTGVIVGKAWTAEAPLPGNGMLEITADYITVEGNSSINMNGRGYTPGSGPGAGGGHGLAGSGGSHGGLPGFVASVTQPAAYGDPITPRTMGSGGGSVGGYTAGTGGGIALITVNTLLTFNNGTISANGSNGSWNSSSGCGGSCYGAGGGAGGSLDLHVNEIAGTLGTISANGGTTGRQGTGGGGGRVSFHYETMSFTGGLAALNLRAFGANTAIPSAAGTVFYKDITDDPNGYIVADNNNIQHYQGVETPLPATLVFDNIITRNLGTFIVPLTDTFNHISSTHNFRLVLEGVMNLPGFGRDITIGPTGYLEWRRFDTVDEFDNITIQTGGVFTHSNNSDQDVYHLDIICDTLNVEGSIDVNGRGYSAGNGTGGSTVGYGASHGGTGGLGSSGVDGISYGSIRNPETLGSGSDTVSGGGRVKVTADTINFATGTISANGTNSGSLNRGGGAGGSIYLIADAINGTAATISATGGDGNGSGGGGGGGRIALAYDTTTYPGGIPAVTYVVRGGNGSSDGAAGTVYHKQTAEVGGNLMVLNEPRTYNGIVTTRITDTIPFDSITTDLTGTPHIPLGYTVTLPGQNIPYRIVVEGDFVLPLGGDDVTIQSTGYFEWRKSTPLTLDNLVIDSGGTLTHTPNSSFKQYYVNVDVNNLTVNGTITANAKGYTPGYGPGYASVVGAGASYGGFGGHTNSSTFLTFNPYGMEKVKAPDELGSSAAYNGAYPGGTGGGYIRLDVANTFTLNGTITANGGAGSGGSGGTWSTGGGSGGSIHVMASTINGSGGTISANGNSGSTGAMGAGSGGRIALVMNTDSYTSGIESLMTSGQLRAYGGTLGNSNTGAAGTIFIKESTDTHGRLYVNNGTNPAVEYVETPVSETLNFDSVTTTNNGTLVVLTTQNYTLLSSDLTNRLVVAGIVGIPGNTLNIKNGGYLEWRRKTALTLNSMTIENGGMLTHTTNTNSLQRYIWVQAANTFDLQVGGTINANGKGFATANGPGGGTGGGAYGGNSRTNKAYGSIKNPVDLGSGGSGSAGGGYVKIVTNTTTGSVNLAGTILANGSNASSNAGAGGTIYIETATLSGGGAQLSVNGGTATSNEAGAGGRIALYYKTDSYAGGIPAMSKTAYGGATSLSGGAGTIFYMDTDTDVNGHLIIQNNGATYAETITTPVSDSGDFDSISTDSSTAIEVKVGESYRMPSATLNHRLIVAGDVSLPLGDNTLTIASGGVLEFRRGTVINSFPNVIVNSGGLITHTSNVDVKQYWVNLATQNLTLNGNIDVDGKGYAATYGTGAGVTVGSSLAAAGGSHAGLGNIADGSTGQTYGSIKLPNDLGSGGGNGSTNAAGAAGGGMVILDIADDFTWNGQIRANGATGVLNGGSRGGAGAGGSVRILTQDLLGSGGSVSVNGGEGAGGNGGGGRVSLTVSNNDSGYSGGSLLGVSMSSQGGTTSTRPAAAGTIYYKGPSDTNGHLKIDNGILNYIVGTETEILTSELFDSVNVASSNTGVAIKSGVTFDMMTSTLNYPLRMQGTAQFNGSSLTVTGTGRLYFDRVMDYTIGSLTLQNGSLMSHMPNSTVQSKTIALSVTNFDFQSGAVIDVSGKGYTAGQGPGRAQSSGGTRAGGGASHGGTGGSSGATSSAGIEYGLPNAPATMGSGGATGSTACVGSSGGGFVKINATNFDFDGSILADGANTTGACTYGGGAGSGGGVYLIANTLTGSAGTISAKGGSTPMAASDGGAGGGGLVKVEATVNSFAGDFSTQISVAGGTGTDTARNGENGSVIHP